MHIWVYGDEHPVSLLDARQEPTDRSRGPCTTSTTLDRVVGFLAAALILPKGLLKVSPPCLLTLVSAGVLVRLGQGENLLYLDALSSSDPCPICLLLIHEETGGTVGSHLRSAGNRLSRGG